MIRKTIFSVYIDGNRFKSNGILLKIQKKIIILSTDGRR